MHILFKAEDPFVTFIVCVSLVPFHRLGGDQVQGTLESVFQLQTVIK